MEEIRDWISVNGVDWGIKIAVAIAIFIVGKIIARIIANLIQKALRKGGTDEMLIGFLGNITYGVLLVAVVLAAVDTLGVNVTSLMAILGAAGLAVGLALKDSLGNFAAGVMIIIFRPFKIGDYVDAGGAAGTVDEIGLFATLMHTPDNKRIIVPNGAIIGGNITNFSARPTRRVDMVFGIGYDDDLLKAKRILQEIIAADKRVLAEPAPVITLGELADSSVNFLVRPWVNAGNYWDVLWETTEAVKLRFDAEGISIPFPQMDLHIQPSPGDSKAA